MVLKSYQILIGDNSTLPFSQIITLLVSLAFSVLFVGRKFSTVCLGLFDMTRILSLSFGNIIQALFCRVFSQPFFQDPL